MENLNKWDFRFIGLAKTISQWSKDPGTKVGVVLVKEKRIISTGYNGFPEGISDSLERYNDREIKLLYTVHAEVNAILNAAKNGSETRKSILYTTFPPCISCSKSIIQAGISTVIRPSLNNMPERWLENFQIAQEVLSEAKVVIKEY
jgi:dCMP deaminase